MTLTTIEKKTGKIAAGGLSLPKPSPRYAQMAAAIRAMGVSIKDDDYEKIDSCSKNIAGMRHPKRRILPIC